MIKGMQLQQHLEIHALQLPCLLDDVMDKQISWLDFLKLVCPLTHTCEH